MHGALADAGSPDMDINHENCPLTDALMNTVDALVVIADPKGRILQFNRACESTTGFAADDVVGRLVVDAVVPADQRDAVADVFDELSSPGTNRFENDWLTADGERRRIAWSNATMTDPGGNVTAIIGTGIDVTEQRILESRLAQADRLDSVGRLAAGMAHDFNNSLTSLVLRIERLAGRELDPDSRVDIDAISGMIDRTQNLINELLSFSSPRRTDPEEVDVHSEIVGVLDLMAGLMNDIEVELDLVADVSTVTIDRVGFEQALTNLLMNARDAMRDGGRVMIATTMASIEPGAGPSVRVPARLAPGHYIEISISDTGGGIEPCDIARVFDPYFTTKPAGRGTGLGLATTYATVTQHRGAITVTSEPGRGATFDVWLPLEAVDPPHVTAPHQVLDTNGGDGAHLALIVDDDPDVREALAEQLGRSGCSTITAADGEAALEHLDDPIDLLLADLHLPDMSGHEVADRFRAVRPDLTIIFATGAPESELEVLRDDAVVVRKPFTMAELLGTIRAHIASSEPRPGSVPVTPTAEHASAGHADGENR